MSESNIRACKMRTILKSEKDKEFKQVRKKLQEIIEKKQSELSSEEKATLKQYRDVVKLLKAHKKYYNERKTRELEVEDDPELLHKKCSLLADLIQKSERIVIYTGAGISTAASIPDYRGPNGVWTRLNNGHEPLRVNDLVLSKPTFTHMAIMELLKREKVQHVVSQNCDGLHLRSGIPMKSLSEIHGNMFIEVCPNCEFLYTRSFDVTERTALRRHETGRLCHFCPPNVGKLIDTIVHFGETGKLKYPLNWDSAIHEVEKADLIICIGSSLKVLRRYSCLWPKKTQLAIINLQWTSKDCRATVKINGKCDSVMEEVMHLLNIPVKPYEINNDQIYQMFIPLKPEEQNTCNRITLDQIVTNQVDYDKATITPGWYGIGMKKT